MLMAARLSDISDGEQGTRDTLRLMAQVTRDAKSSLVIRSKAAEIVSHLPAKDFTAEAVALHAFVRDAIRYLHDINGVETIQTPEVTLNKRYGDCDDKSTLLAAMLESIGHPTKFVAIAKEGKRYCHVLVQTLIGDKWVSAETTEQVPLGWEPMGVTAKMEIYN